jgi:WD40 repeat protein
MLAVSFSPSGRALVASSGANGQGYVWDIETGQLVVDLPSRGGNVGQIAFSSEGAQVVATASATGTAFVSDALTGMELDRFGGGGQTPMFGAAFSPDSKFLLTGNLDGVARLWDLAKYEVPMNDRAKLIALGAQRIMNMSLTDDERKRLRAMNIPIFAFADSGYEGGQDIRPLPFLGPRPSVMN